MVIQQRRRAQEGVAEGLLVVDQRAQDGDGVIQGIRHSSRVIVAAGLIMIGVFSAFVLSSDPKELWSTG
jgi:uncharacterized membrane protein YdfJ with MMPL/SSD domain